MIRHLRGTFEMVTIAIPTNKPRMRTMSSRLGRWLNIKQISYGRRPWPLISSGRNSSKATQTTLPTRCTSCLPGWVSSLNVIRWLNRWKKYVSFEEIISDKQPSRFFGGPLPDKVNEDLIDRNVESCFKYSPLKVKVHLTFLKGQPLECVHQGRFGGA